MYKGVEKPSGRIAGEPTELVYEVVVLSTLPTRPKCTFNEVVQSALRWPVVPCRGSLPPARLA